MELAGNPAPPVSLVLAQFPADVTPEGLDHIGEAVKPDRVIPRHSARSAGCDPFATSS
jgi:hypothetical protein